MIVLALVALALGRGAALARAYTQQCASTAPAQGNPADPLGTPGVTGGNPLSQANLFVDTARLIGGAAANAIAAEVPGFGWMTQNWRIPPLPWATFEARVNGLTLPPATQFRVTELEKIGDFPEAHQFSPYSAGGSGPAVYTQVQNYLCAMQRVDPNAAGEITTYFLSHRGCTSGAQPRFRAEVQGLKAAVGRFPAVIFVEEDALDTVCWTDPATVRGRAALLRYEIAQLAQLPHAVLYVDGGTADGDTAARVAKVLNAADASKLRGFVLGVTHFNWAYREIQYGNQLSRLTHGLHFVVDTRADGQGPVLNPHPVTQGIEELCNPPNRGLGPTPGASDGRAYGMYSPHLDGFVWVTTPGESSAATCPGRTGHWANSGIFDEGLAVNYASHAANRIGPQPRFPILPATY